MPATDYLPPTVNISVIYEDPPDLVEIEARASSFSWNGVARAFAATEVCHQQAVVLESWCQNPHGEAIVEAGADSGLGWVLLKFLPTETPGKVLCRVTLATGGIVHDKQTDEVWRLSLEVPSETRLVEQFARELQSAIRNPGTSAILQGVLR
jgi:hypothetical protein